MLKRRFDAEKAIEAILYVASKAPIPDLYHVGKVLYYADRIHLERYGRQITGDKYTAMKNGPVASGTYDILKTGNEDRALYQSCPCNKDLVKAAFRLLGEQDEYRVVAKRDYDADFFSKSDIKCINEAIELVGRMSFRTLNDFSHDEVWSSANQNDEISLEVIAKHCKDGDLLVEYLRG